ncbi:MAG TPA: GFA family protein [Sphingomicrobium sp.]|nr:GFA family protein [Sphingomicrobium sp.]
MRFTAMIHDHDAYLCHCRMCQRSTGSISIAFKSVKQDEMRWEGSPDWYDSSPIAERPYCRECGTSLGFRFKKGSEHMDLTVASFDDPSAFVPRHHFGAESMHRAWLNTEGLSEIRTADYEKLVDKWIEATGEFPG